MDPWKAASVLLGTIALALMAWIAWSDGTDLSYYNLSLSLPGATAPQVALSPDGTRYLVSALGDGPQGGGLWLRDQSQPRPEPLPALSGARNPAFSPDGRSVAALRLLPGGRSTLLRAPLDGTGTFPLAEGELDRTGHSWGDDGYIYIGSTRGTLRIPAAGGEFELVTRVDTAAGDLTG